MTRRINFGLVLLLALLTVPACGRGGPPDPSAVHDVSVTVSLPAGAAPGTITLSTPYGAGPVTGGSGKAGSPGSGRRSPRRNGAATCSSWASCLTSAPR